MATAGLVAFLLVDVALVALAMRPSGEVAVQPSSAGSHTGTVTPTPTVTAKHTATKPAYVAAPLTVMIVGLDATRAWRARSGTCSGAGALVQTTTNGGRAWTKGTRPAAAIGRIQPLPEGDGFIYAADKRCVLAERTTSDNGQTWSVRGKLSGAWTRNPKDVTVVVTPQAPGSHPCGDEAVLDLARYSGTQAQALCLDGGVKQTVDGGSRWTDAGNAPGALALASRAEDGVPALYVARVTTACAGVEIARVLARGADPVSVACVKTTAKAAPGEVSVSTLASAGWLAVGAETWLAGPNLTTWTKA
ncbi:MAG: hypothetical protein L0H79_14795 [Intrasporangium sp.]|uniref:hypothetical protein n=1 Tax=Intrasporangium sp. TaxID=1925024 RepID=UPI002647F7E4|nr:hypothetical protein [Intrasporangium sp.]MDN5797011.1 hypothetical protein [Intrasporangium sp.]